VPSLFETGYYRRCALLIFKSSLRCAVLILK